MQKSNGRMYGECTKSIYINFRTSPFNPEIASNLLVTCPNLVSLQINIERSDDFSISSLIRMDTRGRPLLSRFAWTGIVPFTELRQLSLRYPNLVSLKLGSSFPIHGTVTFPSVEQLSVDLTKFHYNDIGTFMDLPSLKYLYLQMGRDLGFPSILQHKGHKLLSLELAPSYVGPDTVFLPENLFEQCPKLESLAFENYGTISQQFLTDSRGAAHNPLSTLVIHLGLWDLMSHLVALNRHAQNFPSEMFPNLHRVLLIRHSWGDPKRGLFEKMARDLFPHATVEFKRELE